MNAFQRIAFVKVISWILPRVKILIKTFFY
jgi:hypothetical protein